MVSLTDFICNGTQLAAARGTAIEAISIVGNRYKDLRSELDRAWYALSLTGNVTRYTEASKAANTALAILKNLVEALSALFSPTRWESGLLVDVYQSWVKLVEEESVELAERQSEQEEKQ